MIKLSPHAPPALIAAYGQEVGEIVASETRDGEAYVSVELSSVELCGIPFDWVEEVE